MTPFPKPVCFKAGAFPRARLACAVTLALGGLVAPEAFADDCPTRLSGRLESTCTVAAGSDLQVTASGAIEVEEGPAVLIDHAGDGASTLRNNGTLSAVGGLDGDGATVRLQGTEVTGSLLNNASGVIRFEGLTVNGGDAALRLDDSTLHGAIVNSGLIDGQDPADGLYLSGSRVDGALRNSGTILGSTGVSLVDSSLGGDIRNSGTITGQANGMDIAGSDILGSIRNYGTLEGTDGWGLYVTDTRIGLDVVNTGSIGAGSFPFGGVRLADTDIAGYLINAGDIDTGSLGTGLVMLRGSIGHDLNNRERIAGNNGMSVNFVTLGGDIRNSGTIEGRFNPDGGGFGWNSTGTTVHGKVVNSGTVKAATTAVNFDDVQLDGGFYNSGRIEGATGLVLDGSTVVGGGLTNSGVLQGDDYALRVGDDATLDDLYIAGQNSARFIGEVFAPRTRVTLFSDAGYTLQDGNLFTVDEFVNRGVLSVAAVNAAGASAKATIDGDYRQAAGAVLRTQVQDATHYGQLVVTGTATLPSQARFDVDVANPGQAFGVDRLQDVLSAGTLQSDGTFNVTSNSALFDFGAVKDGNTVDLTLAAKSADGVATAARSAGLDAGGAAQVIDQQLAQGSASAFTPYFVSATSTAEVASSLAQTLPMNSDALRSSQFALAAIGDAVQGRLQSATGQLAADWLAAPGDSVWSQPFSYRTGRADGSALDAASGTVFGFDTRTSASSRAGVAFAYADGGTGRSEQGGQQSNRLGMWQFLGYSSHTLAPDTELMLYAGAGQNRVEGERGMAISGLRGTAKADYDSLVTTVGTSLGKALQLGEDSRLLPSLRLDYNHIHEDAYRERGPGSLAPLLLEVDARDTDQLIAGFDGKLEHAIAPNLRLKASLGVGYDLINEDGALTAAFAGAPGQRFTTTGEAPSPWLLRSGLGIARQFDNGAELSLDYSAQARGDYDDQVASLRVNMPF